MLPHVLLRHCTHLAFETYGDTVFGTVTYSVKYDGALSTASWDTILGDEWDKVAEETAVMMSIKFKEDRSCTLNFNRNIFVQATLVSDVNFETMENYRMHVKEHC